MSAWRTPIWLRLKALIHRRAFDRDLEDEISFHLAMRERKQQTSRTATPMPPATPPAAASATSHF